MISLAQLPDSYFSSRWRPVPCLIAAIALIALCCGTAMAQERSSAGNMSADRIIYPVKFLCGPSSERFQEGMVSGFAATAIDVLNPSAGREVRFTKHATRALPYQEPGPVSPVVADRLAPLRAIEIECNEIRQMLPSQMTEEFRTGYLVIRADARLVVTAAYSARPRDGEIATLSVETVQPILGMDDDSAGKLPDLTVTEIDLDRFEASCPDGPGSCVASVPVTVANVGETDAGSFRVSVRFDPRQSVVVLRDLPGLDAGDAQTFTATTPPGGNCFDPDCQICATADSLGAIDESDESNNDLCRESAG